ncbi:MAG TPA: TOBE domain-containing protein, partial [Planctomycetota bacterium]|nr:TOBE domain-containing protein [Planctomycetota bacterium]
LGRAWLADPALVLLDEPAASLDASMAREVVALLLEAKQAWGIPMVLVTHRSTELMALADDCLLLEKGRIVAQGPPIEVLRQAKAHDTESWTGVDNLLALTVLEHQPKDGLTWLDLGAGERLAAPFVDLPPGQILQIAIRGEDLLLAQLAPGPTSARNHLRGQVTRLESIGGEVLVEVLVGTTRLQARITQGAARALELARDQAVHVLIKTTACTPLWV